MPATSASKGLSVEYSAYRVAPRRNFTANSQVSVSVRFAFFSNLPALRTNGPGTSSNSEHSPVSQPEGQGSLKAPNFILVQSAENGIALLIKCPVPRGLGQDDSDTFLSVRLAITSCADLFRISGIRPWRVLLSSGR